MRARMFLQIQLLCCMFAMATPSTQSPEVSKAEALTIAKGEFEGRDVDYYIRHDFDVYEWTIFVDAEPQKGWEHECYLLTIPKKRRTPSISVKPPIVVDKTRLQMPPSGNFVPLEVKNRYGLKCKLKPSVKKAPESNSASDATKTYAIILSGGVRLISNNERYWNDCSFIYQTLINKYGVPKENIFPLMSDGNDPALDMILADGSGFASQSLDLDYDGVEDIKLAATDTNVQSTLNTLKTKLQKDDHLFIYVIDHGGRENHKSYICLWNEGKLYSDTFADMLAPFTDKLVNVNVLLGQCFSGGFVEDLTKVGCVVATASAAEESSYGCGDIPYDEFVYQWTSAVNGADPWGDEANADTDNNGRITMLEAFEYAKANDRIPYEHPQYVSTPISVGEDLAFNNIPESVDLYIKDSEEDTGKEPNTITQELWKSPSIWIRNENDSIEKHENPIYRPDHQAATIYVKIHNRGKETYTGGQWLHVYWAKASTGFTDKTWKGRELYNNMYVTGGHLEPVYISDAIQPGGVGLASVTWALPKMMEQEQDDEHHFCLYAKILPSHIDEKYEEGVTHFDKKGSNDHAQKNVSIIYKNNIEKGTLVFVRNISKGTKKYSLELVPRTAEDEKLYNYAKVDMKLSPKIYAAWERGGCKSESITVPESNSNDAGTPTVIFTSPQSKLQDISLMGDEFDVVNLKFNFSKYVWKETTYTFDLIQKDENGEIIGGETFIIEAPVIGTATPIIGIEPIGTGEMQLSVDGQDYNRMKWIDKNGNAIGRTESVVVTPTRDNNSYTVLAYDENGDVATNSITLDTILGIKSVITSTNDRVIIEFKDKTQGNTTISLISVLDGDAKISESVAEGETRISLDTSKLMNGIYVVVYSVDGVVIDEKKININ